jgi:hypothetical protein
VQLAPAAIVVPQLLPATAKPLLAVMPVKLRVTLWRFFSVTVPAALVSPTVNVPRFSEPGETVTAAAPDELPLRLTVWGLPGALPVNVSVPVVVPVKVGENVTPTLQLAPAAILVPQVLLATPNPEVVAIPEKLSATF